MVRLETSTVQVVLQLCSYLAIFYHLMNKGNAIPIRSHRNKTEEDYLPLLISREHPLFPFRFPDEPDEPDRDSRSVGAERIVCCPRTSGFRDMLASRLAGALLLMVVLLSDRCVLCWYVRCSVGYFTSAGRVVRLLSFVLCGLVTGVASRFALDVC